MFWLIVLAYSCIKLLLLPSYHSTDFEVHRNWLAITHTLPFDHWYYDETSEWTLDYPPLFAWFEWLLAKVAQFFDLRMLEVRNLGYASEMTVLFQSLSVVVTDFIFAFGCKLCSEEAGKACGQRHGVTVPLFLILFCNAGLFLVDHIHFQYNGFLYGILFLAMGRILQGREVEGTFWFSVLLNLKHIYLYVAPAFFVYLLRSYCLSSSTEGKVKWRSFSLQRLIKLTFTVLAVFTISFGPFVLKQQLGQVLSRLFPFKRGLSHAYWAPNFWALYNFIDKVAASVGKYRGWISSREVGSMTGGLVQEYEHTVLPSVPPLATFLLTFTSILPCLINLWTHPHNPWQLVRSVVLCGFGAFLFGWHVHEKAILLVVLPLGLLVMLRRIEAQLFVMLSIVGNFSIFPLIFTSQEIPIKVTALLLHAVYTCHILQKHWHWQGRHSQHVVPRVPLCNHWETCYLLGLVPLFLYEQVVHRWIGLHESLPFLPLMIISVYCAVGIFGCWVRYYSFILSRSQKSKQKLQ